MRKGYIIHKSNGMWRVNGRNYILRLYKPTNNFRYMPLRKMENGNGVLYTLLYYNTNNKKEGRYEHY